MGAENHPGQTPFWLWNENGLKFRIPSHWDPAGFLRMVSPAFLLFPTTKALRLRLTSHRCHHVVQERENTLYEQGNRVRVRRKIKNFFGSVSCDSLRGMGHAGSVVYKLNCYLKQATLPPRNYPLLYPDPFFTSVNPVHPNAVSRNLSLTGFQRGSCV